MRLKIIYWGHACFQVDILDKGITLVFDPFDPITTGDLSLPEKTADIVLCSHEHFDHANWRPVIKTGGIHLIKFFGEKDVHGIKIVGVKTAHDDAGGRYRGLNSAYLVLVNNTKIIHLGDLGHILNNEQVSMLTRYGRPDILFIPIGSVYTIGPHEAIEIINQLNPRAVFPMHYNHPKLNQGIFGHLKTIDDFLKLWKGNVNKFDKNQIELDTNALPSETTVYVLTF